MTYTAVPTITTGDVATAAWGNTYIKNNFAAGVPDIITADSEVIIGTGANAVEVVAILDSNNRLKHEYGGLEFDASGVTTGDTVVGQSSGVIGLETAMTQGQAQAGTDTQVRGVTALRIKEAITALGLSSPMTANLNMAAYLLVGNGGSTGIAISANGEINTAAQPGFRYESASQQGNVTGAGASVTIVAGTEIYDQNSDFDGTSTFTAPIAGRYWFGASADIGGITASAGFCLIQIVASNRNSIAGVYAPGGRIRLNISQMVDMDSGDEVTITVQDSGEGSNVHDLEAGVGTTIQGWLMG
jgi:hypothetical protein